jgi:2-polyprenyl-3-methyl-5-hydroxy-6-metoxy-1,4-benzoquinol methylase
MPHPTGYARKKRARYFLDSIPVHHQILEVGCGDGWVKEYLKGRGCMHYTGVDLRAPADIVGDIRSWRQLGLKPESYDTIVAFEVVEHVDCFKDCYDLLRPGGSMMITTPCPSMDWVCKLLEAMGVNQRRTSPHDHLVDLRLAPFFEQKTIRRVCGIMQWAVLVKNPR